VGVAFMLLLAPIGLGATRLANAVEDAAHGPLFAAISIGILLSLRALLPRAPLVLLYVTAWALTVVVGGVTEVAQTFTGTRLASLRDLISDAVGAFAGLSAFAVFDSRLRPRAVFKVALLIASAVAMASIGWPVLNAALELQQRRAQFPALLTWETPLGYRSLVPYDANGMTASVPAEWRHYEGERAYYVRPFALLPGVSAPNSWPGVAVDEPWPKWRAYRTLLVDIINPNDSELSLTLRINDWAHNHAYHDRFNRPLQIAPRQRVQIAIPITDIAAGPQGRILNIDAVAKLILFQEGRVGAQPFYLCGMRLAE
jgi:hypothetical protein